MQAVRFTGHSWGLVVTVRFTSDCEAYIMYNNITRHSVTNISTRHTVEYGDTLYSYVT